MVFETVRDVLRPNKKSLTILADRELPVGMGRDVQTKKNHLPKEVAGGQIVRRRFVW